MWANQRAGAGRHKIGKRSGARRHHGETVRELRRSFGMVFQDFQLFPHLTVLGNIVEAPIRVRRQSRAAAEKLALELLRAPHQVPAVLGLARRVRR